MSELFDPASPWTAYAAHARLAIVVLTREFRIVRVNEAWAAFDGRSSDDYLGKSFFALFPQAEIEAIFRRVRDSGEPYFDDAVPYDKSPNPRRGNGCWDWSLSVTAPDEEGTSFLVLVTQDVTDRIRAEESHIENTAHLRELFSTMTSGFALHEILLDGKGKPCDYRFLDVNPAFEAITGLKAADLVGRTVLEVLPGTEDFWIERYGDVALSGDPNQFEAFNAELQRHYRVTAYCPTPGRFATLVDDITTIRRSEDLLRQSAAVFENTRDGVTITDADANIIAVNRAFTAITGYEPDDVVGKNPKILQSGKHEPAFYAAMWTELQEKGFWQGEIWNRRRNGDVFPEWLTVSTVRGNEGQIDRYIGVFTDVSRIKAAEARLEFVAYHDELTGLPNRTMLNVRYQNAVDRALRRGKRLALLVIDLDLFKHINDSLGRPVGDALLVAIGGRFRRRLRDEDMLARLGGDEFAVLIEDLAQADDAALVARNLIAELDAPISIGEHDIHVGASIGISVSPDDGKDPTTVMRNADAAVHLAKAQGRNTFRFYTESLTIAALERITLEARLRKAIDCGHLVVYYQPLIDAASGRVIGSEALVRWRDGSDQLIQPGRFIPVAEDSGLIAPLGAWVLRRACRQMKDWLDAGHSLRTMAVNFSPRQFLLQDVPALVAETLAETGLPAECLELEITEGVLMERGEEAIETLHRLRALGVRLSVDDFGTGYSSLSYLKRFPIHTLKIDQSFVRDLTTDSSDAEMALAIIAMGRALKLQVLAEGVETAAQRNFLADNGCHFYQGFFFGRPVPAAEFPMDCPWTQR